MSCEIFVNCEQCKKNWNVMVQKVKDGKLAEEFAFRNVKELVMGDLRNLCEYFKRLIEGNEVNFLARTVLRSTLPKIEASLREVARPSCTPSKLSTMFSSSQIKKAYSYLNGDDKKVFDFMADLFKNWDKRIKGKR